METATAKGQGKLQAFREGWEDTLAILKEVGEGEALDFGERLTIALDSLDAGLAILSGLGLIDTLDIKLSGWTDSGRSAAVNYSITREFDEEKEHYEGTIHKETNLKELI